MYLQEETPAEYDNPEFLFSEVFSKVRPPLFFP